MDTTTSVTDAIISVSGARELVRYMEWADARLWAAVTTNDAARQDGEISKQLQHIHAVQYMFLGLWTHESMEAMKARAAASLPDLPSLQKAARTYYDRAQEFLAGVTSARFAEVVEMPWLVDYEKQLGTTFARPTVAETVIQVVNHTTHHRAQVQTRVRALGGEPQLVDYIGWIWFGKPAPEWREA
jgi:uncharacterized damage-inducible protein DinB